MSTMNLAILWTLPTAVDVRMAEYLGQFVGRHPLFDRGVQSAIGHNVLGGAWYGAALFVFWVLGRARHDEALCRRELTVMAGSIAAIGLAFIASHLMQWAPPAQAPALTHLFPDYILRSPDTNSFPSQSTTLYVAIAAGVYSLNKLTGVALWIGVFLLVALPRMYVGGHYLTDILVGLVLGVTGYVAARIFLQPRAVPGIYQFMQSRPWLAVVGELVVFAWILQVAIEFRDVVWLTRIWEIMRG